MKELYEKMKEAYLPSLMTLTNGKHRQTKKRSQHFPKQEVLKQQLSVLFTIFCVIGSNTRLSTMKYDDIIAEIGEFGPYQKRVYFSACLCAITPALQIMSSLFTLATPNHRCALLDLPNDTYKSQGAWHDEMVKQSRPWDEDEENYSYCKLITKNTTSGELSNDSYTCSSWVFSEEVFDNTFTRDIEMICDDKSLPTYLNMIFMGGFLAGSPIMGTLSDMIGRKKVVLIGVLGQFTSCLALAFVTSYVPFAILRFANAAFSIGTLFAAYTLGLEIVGPNKRTFAAMVGAFFWSFGLFLLALLAYLIRDWKHLQIATAIPAALLFSLIFVLSESPRWLISRGRYEEAAKIIKTTAEKSGVKLSDRFLNFEEMEEEAPNEKIWGMLTNCVLLIRFLVVAYSWTVASLAYYGLTLNVSALSGNIYLNFTLSSLVETASSVFCLLLLDRVGRKLLLCFTMFLSGIACLGTTFPILYGSDSDAWITVLLSLIGKFGISSAFSVVLVYSAELFPTAMRNSGMGLCSLSSRFAGIFSPYIANLSWVVPGHMGLALPLIIFGGTSSVAGLLALLLPETAGKVLPESIEDAKNFGRKPKKIVYEVNHEKVKGNEKREI